jgi:hypothetical protein
VPVSVPAAGDDLLQAQQPAAKPLQVGSVLQRTNERNRRRELIGSRWPVGHRRIHRSAVPGRDAADLLMVLRAVLGWVLDVGLVCWIAIREGRTPYPKAVVAGRACWGLTAGCWVI